MRGLFHHPAKVGGRGIAISIAAVIVLDARPERLVPHQPAQHVQSPAPFLVDQAVQDLRRIGQIFMNHREAGFALFGRKHNLATMLEPPDKFVAATVVLGKEEREIGREALAQPDVVPISFRDRIAKPLVGDLVGHQVRDVAACSMPPPTPAACTPASFS